MKIKRDMNYFLLLLLDHSKNKGHEKITHALTK